MLEGFEAPAAAWEGDILSARMKDYDHGWLDTLCLSGSAVWGRFKSPNGNGRKQGPIKTTPVTIVKRTNLGVWSKLAPASDEEGLSRMAASVLEFLKTRGAPFFDEIAEGVKGLRTDIEAAIAELVTHGMVTSDSYTGLRAFS